jgi:hypothetical protein
MLLSKGKTGKLFSVAKDNTPSAGCTISGKQRKQNRITSLYIAYSESTPGALFLCLESEEEITKLNQY